MSSELVVVGGEKYPVLANSENIGQVIAANMGGEQVQVSDLNRIKVPSGGGTSWEVLNADGEAIPMKAIEGIIVYTTRRRAYWKSLQLSKDPPDCHSQDMYTGEGVPGGDCEKCPCNVWGSQKRLDGAESRGKACKEVRLVFLLREGSLLPDVVSVPVGSLKEAKQYLLKLSLPYYAVTTRMTLERTTNKDNIDFAKIKFAKSGMLSQDAVKQIMAYAAGMKTLFEQTRVETADHTESLD